MRRRSPEGGSKRRAWSRAGPSAAAAVVVLEAHDVVFAKVRARLHLDDLQRHLARVGEAVRFAERDVGALVLAEQELFLTACHFCRAAHDDPVLGAVVVHLQAQAGAGVDQDALDLEAWPGVDAVVPPPGTVHAAVDVTLAAAVLGQPGDDALHLLAARTV